MRWPKRTFRERCLSYQQRLQEGQIADGVYVHELSMQPNRKPHNRRRNACNGFQVRITALGRGYSMWFGVTQYGSRSKARAAAFVYRDFAIANLPRTFPTRE